MADQYIEQDLVVVGVYSPETGKYLHLEEAQKQGLLDLKRGLYVDPVTGEEMDMETAIKKGMLKARLADPKRDGSNRNRVTCSIRKANPEGETFDQVRLRCY